MSKLAHSNQETMDEIEFWRAYEDGALEPMDTAPRDGREMVAALSDGEAPNQEKVRMVTIVAVPLGGWRVTSRPLDGLVFQPHHFEGWIEP